MVFDCKIHLYHISTDDYLVIKIVNNKAAKIINLMKRDGHFDTIYNKSFIIEAGFC